MLLSVVVIARDGNWTPSYGVIYATFLACLLCHGVLASTMSKIMGKLQTVFVIANFILIFATIIALPIGARHTRNDGHYIFAQTENSTTWPTGWAFMLAWLSPIWTIGGFDSCVHISEEAANATKAVVRSKMFLKFRVIDADMIIIAFWHSDGYWIMLVFRLYHCHRARCMYQPRFKLDHWLEVWPAHGAGKSTFHAHFWPSTLTKTIRSTLTR